MSKRTGSNLIDDDDDDDDDSEAFRPVVAKKMNTDGVINDLQKTKR